MTVDREQLPAVVAEVDRLAQRRRDVLDPEEARAVLAEVGLPPELLEEAQAELARREEAKAQRRRTLGVVLAAVLVISGAATAWIVSSRGTAAALAQTTGTRSVLYDERAPGKDVASVRRAEAPTLRFEVELAHAPRGAEVPLACDWSGPSGTVQHQGTWKTKPVDRDPWPTHCRFTVPSNAETGPWRVRMTQDGREIGARTVAIELALIGAPACRILVGSDDDRR
jgi:hypothetical protein